MAVSAKLSLTKVKVHGGFIQEPPPLAGIIKHLLLTGCNDAKNKELPLPLMFLVWTHEHCRVSHCHDEQAKETGKNSFKRPE